VVFGDQGLVGSLGPGQVLIDMSTVGPEAVREVTVRLPDGVSLVDAPVRGSVPQATAGTLEVFVGATDESFERVRPILESLGDPLPRRRGSGRRHEAGGQSGAGCVDRDPG
jgi:3-hydroxyisobutyrate dehydrogenase-like beta-hydroxyacid dehydrogenase